MRQLDIQVLSLKSQLPDQQSVEAATKLFDEIDCLNQIKIKLAEKAFDL